MTFVDAKSRPLIPHVFCSLALESNCLFYNFNFFYNFLVTFDRFVNYILNVKVIFINLFKVDPKYTLFVLLWNVDITIFFENVCNILATNIFFSMNLESPVLLVLTCLSLLFSELGFIWFSRMFFVIEWKVTRHLNLQHNFVFQVP